MFIRIALASLTAFLVGTTVALASPFDNMSAEEIFARPDFVASTESLNSAMNSGDPDAPHIYWWVGYIQQGDKRFYFTNFGEALTCVKWAQTGEWVPEWVAEALQKLTDEGIIKFNGKAGTDE
jgi:hypothetical protein